MNVLSALLIITCVAGLIISFVTFMVCGFCYMAAYQFCKAFGYNKL